MQNTSTQRAKGSTSPVMEIAVGVVGNLVLVGLFAYYPAHWFGLW